MDIQKIKEYNQMCNQYKKKASDLQAEINYCKNALNDLCKTLTDQLGVEVTPDNLKQIYEEREAKAANTIMSGNAIMENIRRAERGETIVENRQVCENQSTKNVIEAGTIMSSKLPDNPVADMYFEGTSESLDSEIGSEIILEEDTEESQMMKETMEEFSKVTKALETEKKDSKPISLESIDNENNTQTKLSGFISPFDDDGPEELPKSDYKMPQSFINIASGLNGFLGISRDKDSIEQI